MRVSYRALNYNQLYLFFLIIRRALPIYEIYTNRTSPVRDYRRQGATKIGVTVEDHAVIYTGDQFESPPELLSGEGITKQALRVITDGNEILDTCSRINFGKTYTVEHDVKVLSIGIIAPEHLYLLENYWKRSI